MTIRQWLAAARASGEPRLYFRDVIAKLEAEDRSMRIAAFAAYATPAPRLAYVRQEAERIATAISIVKRAQSLL